MTYFIIRQLKKTLCSQYIIYSMKERVKNKWTNLSDIDEKPAKTNFKPTSFSMYNTGKYFAP